jgi:hypothetical protein
MDKIPQAQGVQWTTLVDPLMNLWFLHKVGNFLISFDTVSLSRSLLYRVGIVQKHPALFNAFCCGVPSIFLGQKDFFVKEF